MRLGDLLQHAQLGYRTDASPDLSIEGICDDSRRAKPGDLFIARPGTKDDGSKYAADAVANGATALVTKTPIASLKIPQIVVTDTTVATSKLADAFFGHPTRSLRVLGITGTNGKTTTAYLLRHILARCGAACGLIGTVEIDDGVTRVESDLTTPGAIDLARLFAAMRDNGCAAAAMEVSSHSLAQGRVASVQFTGAGFTNLTGDHLDFHGTMDAYADAKAKLFEMLDESAVAVVNGDDTHAPRMTRDCRGRVVRYSMRSDFAEYHADHVSVDATGTRFTLHGPSGSHRVAMQLVGLHNIQNALTAAILAIEAMGLPAEEVVNALSDAAGAPGRLERVRTSGHAPSVLVDYAHTDDALLNVLSALKPLTKGKLRVVFGCGGDRDRTKRPRMFNIARQLAHAVYVTSDNPRTENPDAIIRDILNGVDADTRQTGIVVEADRRKAIRQAIADASPDDVVLIAGKGHEKYQIVGAQRLHFDDVEEAENALRRT
jgi:UDP-N-acetylmuramoyl-L-alanyl-D-glutamate--2,6-diaminopimelate ligase